jgi:type III secretion protein T
MEEILQSFTSVTDCLKAFLLGMSLLMARPMVIFTIIPFMSSSVISGVLQMVMIFSLTLPLAPMVLPQFMLHPPTMDQTLLILIKEALVGIVIGFLTGIPFWIAEGVGFVVDNQRGTTMASVFNPLSGETTSPLGILLNVTSTALFFASGCFLIFLSVFYGSYLLWPIDTWIPSIDGRFVNFFLGSVDHMFRAIVLYASPMMILMFLSDFGLGLMNRFAQQLNVFTLSMPIKSALALFILILYMAILFEFFKDEFNSAFILLGEIKHLFR